MNVTSATGPVTSARPTPTSSSPPSAGVPATCSKRMHAESSPSASTRRARIGARLHYRVRRSTFIARGGSQEPRFASQVAAPGQNLHVAEGVPKTDMTDCG